jgi:N-acyl-D-amino-acid deacylase
MYDTLIANALILDGCGTGSYVADLAVKDGLIADIGHGLGVAAEVIDATGLALMPGIIDGHTHFDAQLTWDPMADPSPALGVTTVVIGNCGFTIAPCRPEDRDLTLRNLTHVEGMSLEALRQGVVWEFDSFPEYLDFLDRRGVGPNVAAFVGHSGVRSFVMGEDASKRAATDDEIAQMARIVREALDAGAVGFSSTTADAHSGENGIPMPSRLADMREFEALSGELRNAGKGVFMITRGNSTSIASLEELTSKHGRTTLVSGFLHNPANPQRHVKLLAELKAARSRGHSIFGEVTCCPFTMEFTLESAYVFEGYPAWLPAMQAHGGEDLRQVFRDESFRKAVKANLLELKGTRIFNSEWDKLNIVAVANPGNSRFEGMTVAAVAAQSGQHPLDCMLDLALSEDLKTLFTAVLLNSDTQEVAKIITDPENYITLSDAGAHTTFFCDAGFGLHLLGHWVRDLKVMSLEHAVSRLTSQPAALFGIRQRGQLKSGYAADLLLFDPKTIGRGPTKRVHDLPAGAARLITPSIGIHGVWVNGVRLVTHKDQGIAGRDRLPGKLLRAFVH